MKIPYGKQTIDEDDIEAVVKVMKSDWLTQGPDVQEFEEKMARYVGTRYAVAFNSGTSALHGAMFAAGIGKGDEIITSPITFVASANCAVYLGAIPKFADINLNTYCINPDKIELAITEKTKAIVPVDLAGYPVDLEKIQQLAEKYNLTIIEDAAHALGAERNGEKVGTQADMTMFSFHPVKHITTAEGGIITTNSKNYYEKMLQFRSHGITKDPEKIEKKDGPWYYEMQTLGYNYRITDIQCALGISQLKKIDKFIKRRRELAGRYDEAFKENPLITVPPRPKNHSKPTNSEVFTTSKKVDDRFSTKHVFHIYPVLLNKRIDQKQVFEKLREKGILCQIHYIPVHHQPYYRQNFGYTKDQFPNANAYYNREITIPLFPKMTDDEQAYVIKTLNNILDQQK